MPPVAAVYHSVSAAPRLRIELLPTNGHSFYKKCQTVSTPSHADFFPCFFDLALCILQCLCCFFRFVSQIVHLPSRFLCRNCCTLETPFGILSLLFGLIGVVGSLFECCSGMVCDGLRLAQCFLRSL